MKKITLIIAFLALVLVGAAHAEWCDGADVNHNGVVDTFDQEIMDAYFKAAASCTIENDYCQGLDFDDSGDINIIDLSLFVDNKGRTDCTGDHTSTVYPIDKWCDGADVDHNGAVDTFDYDIFAAYFRAAATCNEEINYCQGLDFNDDGTITVVDLTQFGDHYHRTDCEEQEVPEFGLIAGGVAFAGALLGFVFLRKKK